ncbi:MAG: polyprenyl synthetase family protein [Nitrospinae bacterium]|nr:polyprenyl synthetase family protein [Nitrospinota bacterium]
MPLTAYFNEIRAIVDDAMDRLVPPSATHPAVLHEAMRYSLFAGGKRLRPTLAMAACDAVGGARSRVVPFAVALEAIHTYTLIHDDLPAMDNDDYRRGLPTSHKKFGEAAAILAGDALLTLAFEIISNLRNFPGVSPETLLEVSRHTANAVGSVGTVGGQMADIQMEGAEGDMASLEYIHIHKTGKLIAASVRGGALLGGGDNDAVNAITEYGKNIGLAFQIVDDILDIEGELASLGKTPGSDTRKKKLTYPALMGVAESRKLASRLTDRAIGHLAILGSGGERLSDLAKYVIARAF